MAFALATPAGAGAVTPAESLLQRATQAAGPGGQAVANRAGAALPGVRRTAGATARRVTGAEPVRSVLDTARAGLQPVAGAAADVPRRAAGAATASRDPLGRPPAVVGGDAGPRPAADGSIDRAATRHGESERPVSASPADLARGAFDPLLPALDSTPGTTGRPAADASSAAAQSGDDGPGHDPLPRPGTGAFGGPAGIALLGFAILLASSILAPRFRTRLLRTSAGHRELGTFLTPIERPG